MAERFDVEQALRTLPEAVREVVAVPPPELVRARARRRPRSQAFVGLVAAAAVIVVALGVGLVVRTVAGRPVPGVSPSVSPSVSPAPSATLAPGPVVRPSLSVPPWPATSSSDPITKVDWANATITVPVHPDRDAHCPSGQLRLSGGISSGYPQLSFFDRSSAGVVPAKAYGDLNGDGRLEAVLVAGCRMTFEDSGDGAGQLLVVTRSTSGQLTALPWVGPRGAIFAQAWVAGGALFAEVHPWHSNDWSYSLGGVLAWRLSGGRFNAVASGYRGMRQATPSGRPVADIVIRTVASLMNCPGTTIRFNETEPANAPLVGRDGQHVYYLDQPQQPDGDDHWLDLAGSGHRYLVVAMACYEVGTSPTIDPPLGQGVLALEPDSDGYHALDFVPVDFKYRLGHWTFDRGRLTLQLYEASSGTATDPQTWVWNGTYFQR
jgi:hypothetical protein